MNVSLSHTTDIQSADCFMAALPVVGLHCSGADGTQWNRLFSQFEEHRPTLAPSLLGTASRGRWEYRRRFTLAQEAREVIPEIEALGMPVHIVGHSYGGALALHIARKRPELVRSLCLYEPTLFSVLGTGTLEDWSLQAEIIWLTRAIRNGIEEGSAEFSAEVFTDFWGGLGSWTALSKDRRDATTAWVVKAPSDFDALLREPEPENIIVRDMPVTLLVGEQTQPHARRIAELLSLQSKRVNLKTFASAGHLGPFTFKERFEREVLACVQASEPPTTGKSALQAGCR